jgi:hypothetical protein
MLLADCVDLCFGLLDLADELLGVRTTVARGQREIAAPALRRCVRKSGGCVLQSKMGQIAHRRGISLLPRRDER